MKNDRGSQASLPAAEYVGTLHLAAWLLIPMNDLKKTLSMPYDVALQKVPEALKTEGFGVLTTIDIKDTLKKKIDVDFRRYSILGACNPTLAHQALSTSLEVGTLLPCNVIVYEDGAGSVVQAVDPLRSVGALGDARFQELARQVREKLERVLQRLG